MSIQQTLPTNIQYVIHYHLQVDAVNMDLKKKKI